MLLPDAAHKNFLNAGLINQSQSLLRLVLIILEEIILYYDKFYNDPALTLLIHCKH